MSEPTDGYVEAQRRIDAWAVLNATKAAEVVTREATLAASSGSDASDAAYALAQAKNELQHGVNESGNLQDTLSTAQDRGAILRL